MRILFLNILYFFIWANPLKAQISIRLMNLPAKYTPTLDTLFVAGNFNNWNPRDPNFRFQKNPQGQLQVSISGPTSNFEFKITRGSWATVEVAANGQDIPNRIVANTPGLPLEISVADWADTKGSHTTGSQVQILSSQFWLPQLKRYRRIWVCLPTQYSQEPNRRYPVMYFHDGQNVFDAATSFAGEWRVDEALQQLEQTSGWEPIIAVGIDNGGSDRISELTPFRNPTYGGGRGALYAADLAWAVKPLIDSLFRTKKEKEFTAIGGSSLGGIQTLYMAYKHADVYSKALIFSPSLWFSDSLRQYCVAQPPLLGSRLYWACGTNESAGMVTDLNQCYNDILSSGMPANQMFKKIVSGGTHSEGFWSSQVREGIQWLFGTNTSSLKKKEVENLSVGFREGKFWYESLDEPVLSWEIWDLTGKRIASLEGEIKVAQSPGSGVFFLKFITSRHTAIKKVSAF